MDETQEIDDEASPRPASAEDIEKRLLKFVTTLASRGVKVVILTSTPHALYRVPDILARKARYGLKVDERAELPQFLFENRTAFRLFADPQLRREAKVIDLYPFFCGGENDGRCKVADGPRPYFFDESHLSLFGAKALAPILQQAFE